MERAFQFKDDKSDKFWMIRTINGELAVFYGKTGTLGRCDIKEFDSAEECEKQADKLIAAKVKKGYAEIADTAFRERIYIDHPDYGPHRLTSHPVFISYFTDDIYYDCGDEETPFGSDEGSDALDSLEEYIKKYGDKNIADFPRRLIENDWDMTYYPPDTPDEEALRELISQPASGIPISQLVIQSDQVIMAAAFGQIKVMGKLDETLKEMGLRSILRLQIVYRLEGYNESEIYQQLYQDLCDYSGQAAALPSETCKGIIDYLKCPCEVFPSFTDDDALMETYEKALEDGRTGGYFPLLIVVDDILLEKFEIEEEESEDGETCDLAPIPKLFREIPAEWAEDAGPVEDGMGQDHFGSYWQYDSPLSKEIILAKLPTDKPWEAARLVPMGGFNECPDIASQMEVMKYWYDTWQAVPAVVSYDTWEFRVPAPVADSERALRLAMEHYAFCGDIIDQSDDLTLGQLADSLMQSTVWYFWWD